jgi:ADP-dependent NAD(P)H-hydrate dehydratase / NAD(P)H-hydrate epimerase
MLKIVGTVPDDTFPLSQGRVVLKNDGLLINGIHIPMNRGTPALIGAALMAGEVLKVRDIEAVLAGDIGLGSGSRQIYDHLTRTLPAMELDTLVFHYLQPDVDWHHRVLFAVEEMGKRPVIIADAGFMYAAKMSGQAEQYDLFTPDVGELSFLADETAPHPFYTRGFILHQDDRVPQLISRAYEFGNGARHLLVKGSMDYVVDHGQILHRITKPSAAAMEAMGGTGDTLTGLACTLIESGMDIPEAARIAAITNRLAGVYAHPTPATQVMEIIRQIPKAMTQVLQNPDTDW